MHGIMCCNVIYACAVRRMEIGGIHLGNCAYVQYKIGKYRYDVYVYYIGII